VYNRLQSIFFENECILLRLHPYPRVRDTPLASLDFSFQIKSKKLSKNIIRNKMNFKKNVGGEAGSGAGAEGGDPHIFF
jgi:hypothetical protein